MDPFPDEDILDVAPPVEIPEAAPIHIWVMIGMVLAGLALLIIGILRNRAQATVSPKQRALDLLATLRGRAAQMDGYQFGVAVSDILRNYLTEAHANLKASQQTSREFLDDLKAQEVFSERNQERLSQFLETCDFLKYAPVGRATEPNQDLLDQASLFIREDLV